jgi:NAD dependent epimerase/dehydratase family enzyme
MEEDNIRTPDKIIEEQLIDDTRSDFEKQIDEAIHLSMKDINEQRIYNMKYEEEILQEYMNETKNRKNIFQDFLINITKISKYDKEVKNIYEIIEPIIDSYISQYIEVCELDGETYDKIFNILSKIRHNELVFNTLKKIILREK